MIKKNIIIRHSQTLVPAFLISFIDGLNYTWFAGNYKFFHGPNAIISLSESELSLLASLLHFGRLVLPVLLMFTGRNLGRKPVLVVAAIFLLAANSMLLVTESALILQISRIISGFSVGLGDSVNLVYIGEVSTERARGLNCALNMSCFLSGMLMEYVLTTILDYTSATVVLIIADALTVVACFALVESPYYQAATNQPDAAKQTLGWLWNLSDEQATNKLSEINESIEATKNDRFFQLIQKKAVYKSFLIATIFGIITSLVNVTICSNANLIIPSSDVMSSDVFAIIFSGLSTVAITLSAISIHNCKRKTLLTWSFTLEILFYAIIAAMFFVHQKSIFCIPHFAWIVFATITISHFIFQLGIYSTTMAVRSEVYPYSFKILATNAIILCNAATNFISTYSFMYFKEEFGMYLNFVTFSMASLVGLLITVCMLPETKDKTLEEIQRILEGK